MYPGATVSQLAKALNRGAMLMALVYALAVILAHMDQETRRVAVAWIGGMMVGAVWLYRKTRN